MTFTHEKFLIIALVAPIFIALMTIYGAYKTLRKLEMLADESMQSELLSNFCQIKWRARFALTMAIPVIYAIVLAEGHMGVGTATKTDVSRWLIPPLIILIGVESLTSHRKRDKAPPAKPTAG